MSDSDYWGPPRHDLPLTHATPNPTDSYRDPGIGGGDWSQPTHTAGNVPYGGGSGASSGAAGTGGVSFGGSIGPSKRSTVVAVVLAFLLGPLGLFYVSLLSGVAALVVLPVVVRYLAVMIAIALNGGVDTVYTLAVPILWCIAVPWAVIGVKVRNARIDRAAEKKR